MCFRIVNWRLSTRSVQRRLVSTLHRVRLSQILARLKFPVEFSAGTVIKSGPGVHPYPDIAACRLTRLFPGGDEFRDLEAKSENDQRQGEKDTCAEQSAAFQRF